MGTIVLMNRHNPQQLVVLEQDKLEVLVQNKMVLAEQEVQNRMVQGNLKIVEMKQVEAVHLL